MIKPIEIFSVPSSRQETLISLFIVNKLKKIPNVEFFIDPYGNIAITKGKSESYPMFTAHLDTVHDYPNGYHCGIAEGIIFAWDDNKKQVGVGGDRICCLPIE